MTNQTIAITGATGNIGKELIKNLTAKGCHVRAIGRDKTKLQALSGPNVELCVGDLEQLDSVKSAFSGVTAVFALIPPHYGVSDFRAYQNKVSANFVSAIELNAIKFVVHLSSFGAQVGINTGPINGLYDSEQRLNQLSFLNVVHLRPGYFMENHFFNVELIKHQGINGSPLRADLPVSMIATKDIAAVASDYLSSLSFSGKTVRELHGPQEYTMQAATKILGQAIGKPDLKYVQFPYSDAEKAMLAMGMSADVARLFIEMYKGMNEGIVAPTMKRSSQTTTPTTLEEFALGFAKAFQ